MRAEGQAEEAIRNFRSAYERVVKGDEVVIPSADLEPAGDVPALEELRQPDQPDALKQFAVIKRLFRAINRKEDANRRSGDAFKD